MLNYLWIAIGGALGSVSRFWVSEVFDRHLGESFPWATLLVNVSGSFAIGLFATLTGLDGRWLVTRAFRHFFMVGLCGGYTTFSAFSLQTLNLLRDGHWFYAAANVVLSVILCMVAVWLGHLLATSLSPARAN